jgi:CDP-diacylglycerol--glycerol-3-phosphate 3-phosphatidyltransferase
MNLPNQLTVSRFALTLALLVVMFWPVEFYLQMTAALLLFSAASLTDYFDGKLARQHKLITNFGILMDPLADKILVCSVFIAFVGLRWLPAWMAVVIVARELAITGLRLLAASKNMVLAAEGYGKHKTISQIVAIIAVLVAHSCGEWGPAGRAIFEFPLLGRAWVLWVVQISVWLAVALTMVSGALYLWRNRQFYLQDL